jgi:hypothetical protein
MRDAIDVTDRAAQQQWLKTYYFARAAFSIAWVLSTLGAASRPALAAVLIVAYPAWDALANLVDARRSGGIAASRTQALNVVISLAVAVALAVGLPDMHRVLRVFGAWAILSGLLQLGTALRRRKTGRAQWPMVLSGAQSALAGGVFIFQAGAAAEPSIATVAGYAGFGAFYFLISAVSLTVAGLRDRAG